jgi:hypothetical protein
MTWTESDVIAVSSGGEFILTVLARLTPKKPENKSSVLLPWFSGTTNTGTQQTDQMKCVVSQLAEAYYCRDWRWLHVQTTLHENWLADLKAEKTRHTDNVVIS